ncbi:MAG: DUF2550 family protein [Actinomycetaceae bacterium]|nr:DUF2550 family protein [Actinomycetaceae bacterium]
MVDFLDIVVGVLFVALVITAIVWLWLNIRARRLSNAFGSFRCWSRPDTNSGWTSGVGLYGTEELRWFRLISFSNRPVYSFPRRGLEVSPPLQRSTDGKVIEVRLASGDQRLEIAIDAQTYNGLVSWVESGPPVGRG